MIQTDGSVKYPQLDFRAFFQAAYTLAVNAPVPFKDVKFFLATSDRDVLNMAREWYGQDKIIFYDGKLEAASKDGFGIGLITFMLMSSCDDIVGTELSSYGIEYLYLGIDFC